MAEWSSNNAACRTTWGTMRALGQTRKTFPNAAIVRMQDLAFWNATASAAMRRSQAEALARQLDGVFTFVRGAVMEQGITSATAVQAMVGVLTQEDRTLADLADVNDAHYHFLGEP